MSVNFPELNFQIPSLANFFFPPRLLVELRKIWTDLRGGGNASFYAIEENFL